MLFDPGCCGCETPATHRARVRVRGCGQTSWVGGQTVQWYRDPSRTMFLGTSTTDVDGYADYYATASGVVYATVIPTIARFQATPHSGLIFINSIASPSATTISMWPAAGYRCTPLDCLYPAVETLHLTLSILPGPMTLGAPQTTWSTGIFAWPYDGCGGCSPRGTEMQVRWELPDSLTVSFRGNALVCPPFPNPSSSAFFFIPLASHSCPPGLIAAFSGTYSPATLGYNTACGPTITATITE